MKSLLFAILLFAMVSATQAQTIECKIAKPISMQNSDTEPSKPTTKTVARPKNAKTKSSSEYFGMFKRLIPDTSK